MSNPNDIQYVRWDPSSGSSRNEFSMLIPARTIANVAEERSRTIFSGKIHQALNNFYKNKTILVTSQKLADATSRRFVPLGDLQPVSVAEMIQTFHGGSCFIDSESANVITGWSGVGKTSVATLPQGTNLNASTTPKLICAMLTPKELDDAHPRFSLSLVNEFHNMKNTDARDDAVTVMVALGFLKLFGIALDALFPNNVDADPDGSKTSDVERNTTIRVPDPNELLSADVVAKVHEALTINRALPRDHELRFVIDDAGGYPALIRALCNAWVDTIRPLMQKLFRVPKISNIYLFVVGTGAESLDLTQDVVSMPEYFTVSSVNSSQLFHDLLRESIEMSGSNNSKDFLVELRDTLYFNTETPQNSSSDAARIGKRPGTRTVMHFSQLVSDNARCAALAINQIQKLIKNGYFVHCDDSTQNDPRELPFIEKLSSLLDVWSMRICSEFIRRNGLRRADNPFDEIGRALKIVMSRRTELTSEERRDLVVKYGLLFDTATIGRNFPRYRMSQSIVSMYLFSKNFDGTCQGGNDDAFEQMVAEHHALCLSLQAIKSDEPFFTNEDNVDDDDDDSQVQSQNPIQPKSYSMFATACLERPVKRINLREQLVDCKMTKKKAKLVAAGTDSPVKSAAFSKLELKYEKEWKEYVRSGGALSIVNGSKAAVADVMVLTRGIAYFTQCKHLEPTTTFTLAQATEEFDKMLSGVRTIFTRKLIIRCCSDKDEETCEDFYKNHGVTFVASIVLFSQESTLNNNGVQFLGMKDDEQFTILKSNWMEFNHTKQYIYPFSTSATPLGLRVDATNCSLYPILTGAIDDNHFLNARNSEQIIKCAGCGEQIVRRAGKQK